MSDSTPQRARPRNVLMVAPELTPFAKVGGLADAVAALAKELARLGDDVRVFLPRYGSIGQMPGWRAFDDPFPVQLGSGRTEWAKLWQTTLGESSVTVYLMEYNLYFAGQDIYAADWQDEARAQERFPFFARAALALPDFLDWTPDVIHCHDWPAALVPVMLNSACPSRRLVRTASIFTIHNLQHQGYCHSRILDFVGIPAAEYRADSLESHSQVNAMKGALYHSTKLTTVSPTYAREIQTPQFGCGLEDVLRFRAADLIGIINGIDTQTWDPEIDTQLPARFTVDDFSGKAVCRKVLRHRFGLSDREEVPVFGVISRLWDQKGLDILAGILPRVMENMQVQFVILGAGDSMLEKQFQLLGAHFPGRIGVRIGYDNALSHLIEGGSDFFVMPSRFEPCGLNQMYSMRYGTLPIVRSTGGLADTVVQYREGTGEGTGFLFEEASYNGLYYTLGWACSTFYDRQDEFLQLRRNAMQQDFSWTASALKYRDVHSWAIAARSPQEKAPERV